MSVSTISVIRHNKFNSLLLKHTKSLKISNIPSWEVPHLGIFHEIQKMVSEYAKDLDECAPFHCKYHLSQLL